jgi:PAS domain S-box-containing protein
MPERSHGWRALFGAVFDRSTTPMSLLDVDRRVLEANEAKARFLRIAREALIGLRVEDLVVPEQRAKAARDWTRALRADEEFVGEYDMLRGDGTSVRVHYATRRARVNGSVVFLCVERAPPPAERPGREGAGRRGTLTPREREIARLLALGNTGPQIAEELVVAHDTVRTHVRNAMDKTGARTRAHLVAIVLADELI